MVYRAKKDWWVGCILGVACLALFSVGVVGAVLLARAELGNAGADSRWPGLLLLLEGVLGGLLLWAFLSARYEITAADLVVRFGPLWRRIPLGAVEEVVPRRGFTLDWGENLALSLDRLAVRYRKPGGRLALLPLVISPADKEGFLRELVQVVPGLRACPDGAWRRAEYTAA
jgi:hypothetical protein